MKNKEVFVTGENLVEEKWMPFLFFTWIVSLHCEPRALFCFLLFQWADD